MIRKAISGSPPETYLLARRPASAVRWCLLVARPLVTAPVVAEQYSYRYAFWIVSDERASLRAGLGVLCSGELPSSSKGTGWKYSGGWKASEQ